MHHIILFLFIKIYHKLQEDQHSIHHTSCFIGNSNRNFLVKSASSSQRRIKSIWSICCSNYYHRDVWFSIEIWQCKRKLQSTAIKLSVITSSEIKLSPALFNANSHFIWQLKRSINLLNSVFWKMQLCNLKCKNPLQWMWNLCIHKDIKNQNQHKHY